MKKNVKIIAMTLLFAIIGCVAIACDNTPVYKVTFIGINGTSVVRELNFKQGETAVEIVAPEVEGKQFVEWQLDGVKFDFSTKIEKDITLKASYIDVYDVTFVGKDGNEIAKQKIALGATATEIPAPKIPGFRFIEWQLNGSKFYFTTPIDKHITITAVYEMFEDWQFDSKTGTIVDYVSSFKVMNVPAEIDGVAVVALGENLFKGDKVVEKITVPASVKEVKFGAFSEMENLKEVEFAQSTDGVIPEFGIDLFENSKKLEKVTLPANASISSYMFKGCTSLTQVVNVEKAIRLSTEAFEGCTALTNIDASAAVAVNDGAFANCTALTSVKFSDKLYTLGERVFENCTALTSFEMPKNVTTSNINMFNGCTALKTLTVAAGNTKYSAVNNVLYQINSKGEITSLYYVPATVTALEIPATVTSVTASAFNDAIGLATLTVAEGNTKYVAENNVVYQINTKGEKTNLTFVPAKFSGKLEIPATVTYVDTYALKNANGVTDITVAEGNTALVVIAECLYKKGYSDTYSLISVCNRKDVKTVTILGGDEKLKFSGVNNDNAFAFSNVKFAVKAHTNFRLLKKYFGSANAKIYANEAWKVSLAGTPYSNWSEVADMVEWSK